MTTVHNQTIHCNMITVPRGVLRRQSRHNFCPSCQQHGERCDDLVCKLCKGTLLFGEDMDKAMEQYLRTADGRSRLLGRPDPASDPWLVLPSTSPINSRLWARQDSVPLAKIMAVIEADEALRNDFEADEQETIRFVGIVLRRFPE